VWLPSNKTAQAAIASTSGALAVNGLLAADAQCRGRQGGESCRADRGITVQADSVRAFLDAPQGRARLAALGGYGFEIPHGEIALGGPQAAIEHIGAVLNDDGIALSRRTVQFDYTRLENLAELVDLVLVHGLYSFRWAAVSIACMVMRKDWARPIIGFPCLGVFLSAAQFQVGQSGGHGAFPERLTGLCERSHEHS
jgi:hypothetical protein